MNRDQHAEQARHATIDIMAAEARLQAQHKEFETLCLLATTFPKLELHRGTMHDQLDVLLDAVNRQKEHLRLAMKADY